jgi:hypothetical protein
MHGLFTGIGRLGVRRKKTILLVWAVLLVAGVFFAPRLQEVFERELVSGNTGDSQPDYRRGLLQWLCDWLQGTGKIAPGDLELVQATADPRAVRALVERGHALQATRAGRTA